MPRRSRVNARKQLSMVLPVDLIEAIKRRAGSQGLSITAYVSSLVRADLGQPACPDLPQLAEQVRALQAQVAELERRLELQPQYPGPVDLL